MIFDLDESENSAWFDFEDGSRVQIRTCDADTLKEIRKQTTKKKVEYKRIDGIAERFLVDDTDEDKQNALIWDHCIMAWEGFFDAKKKPIPCNSEMKHILMTRSLKLARFVGECLRKLSEDENAQAEALEKN
jgi:hypothetical protein